ncbi:hypothetical protein Nepgr_003904 [Nepenthes gracilis]|uniref:Uncharacterized protein n=1 Tax=Nepenthes gracilis TaxID=150966 RepID=A0AAD3S0D4_NEPGR|nr:hypothetical protein Nepgr_003904 [Nepenthes gracilis]
MRNIEELRKKLGASKPRVLEVSYNYGTIIRLRLFIYEEHSVDDVGISGSKGFGTETSSPLPIDNMSPYTEGGDGCATLGFHKASPPPIDSLPLPSPSSSPSLLPSPSPWVASNEDLSATNDSGDSIDHPLVNDGSSGPAVADHSELELQSCHTNEDALDEAPTSCSSPDAASLGLIAAVNDKAPSNTLIGCSQVDIDLEQHNEAFGVHLTCLGWPDPGSDHGVALVGPKASLFLGDQVAESKPLQEAIWAANELLNSIPSHANCPGQAPHLVVHDQPTSIGNQDIQNPLVLGFIRPALVNKKTSRMKLTVRADEGSCVEPVENSLYRIGMDSQPPPLDAVKPIIKSHLITPSAKEDSRNKEQKDLHIASCYGTAPASRSKVGSTMESSISPDVLFKDVFLRNPLMRELLATRKSTFQIKLPAWQPASNVFKSGKPPGNKESQQSKHSTAQRIRIQEPGSSGVLQITWNASCSSTSADERPTKKLYNNQTIKENDFFKPPTPEAIFRDHARGGTRIQGYRHAGLEGESAFLCHVSQPIQKKPVMRELLARLESTCQIRTLVSHRINSAGSAIGRSATRLLIYHRAAILLFSTRGSVWQQTNPVVSSFTETYEPSPDHILRREISAVRDSALLCNIASSERQEIGCLRATVSSEDESIGPRGSSSHGEGEGYDVVVPTFDDVELKMAMIEAWIVAKEASPNSASRIVTEVEHLWRKLLELKANRCLALTLQLPSCSQAARGYLPDEVSVGCEAAA